MRNVKMDVAHGGIVVVIFFVIVAVVSIIPKHDNYFIHGVPFTCQAPDGEWDIAEFQEGCEEADAAMVLSWIREENELSTEDAKSRILALCKYEKEVLGFFQDTGVDDTADMLRDFWRFDCAILEYPTINDLQKLLSSGFLVMVPINGTLSPLKSIREGELMNYRLHEMTRHMMLLIGYDNRDGTFIVHDSATRHGAFYKFNQSAFLASICDYPSRGAWDKEEIDEIRPKVIAISRKLTKERNDG